MKKQKTKELTDEEVLSFFGLTKDTFKKKVNISMWDKIEDFFHTIYWWSYYTVKEIWWSIKYAYQRVDRGYDDLSMWNFDEHIARQIKEICFNLAENHLGYPDKLTDKEWTQVLKGISFGFGSYLEMRSGEYTFKDKEYKRLEKEYKNGMKLFIQYHPTLWD